MCNAAYAIYYSYNVLYLLFTVIYCVFIRIIFKKKKPNDFARFATIYYNNYVFYTDNL